LALTLLGGIGIFLLGMVLLTDGLKEAAGSALRDLLGRLTGGPTRAAVSGAAITALVQSSSATTLATIGFVSAGLLTFPQSIGLILGANIGTTSTGWIVSVLGLKADIGALALPLVAAGALMRLLGRERVPAVGLALAGFGLIFVGIDFIQDGMASLAEGLDLEAISTAGILGRVTLVAVGAVMTVLMQSSSAAVATTLTAVHTGAIDLEAAAALVVGQNVGTTVKAALAGMGGSVPARRTAVAHIGFNVLTALGAFLLLPFVPGLSQVLDLEGDPAIALAAFHTGFNLLGVALFLPFTVRYAAFIERMVPDHGSALTRHLDPSVASLPAVALEVARRTVMAVAAAAFVQAHTIVTAPVRPGAVARHAYTHRAALAETRRFLARVRTSPDVADEHRRHVNLLHALDHLQRLEDALDEPHHAAVVRGAGAPPQAAHRLAEALMVAARWCEDEQAPSPVEELASVSADLAERRRAHRRRLLADAATRVDPDEAMRSVDAMMWLDRIGYHAWRSVAHLAGHATPPGAEPVESEAYAEPEPVTGEAGT
jgi:phosphate:Na+ symporter